MRYKRLLQAFYQTTWAILPEKLLEIRSFLHMKVHGADVSREAVDAIIAARREDSGVQMSGRVAVLPMFGTFVHRASDIDESSGLLSTEGLGVLYDALLADKAVKAIVLVFDSPGGSVFGLEELAKKIFNGRDQKRTWALADPMAASAAYYLASQAEQVYVTPSGQVGSIGTITAHEDLSAMLEQLGVKVSLITAGKYKGEGNPYGPLDDDARASLQDTVNQYYGQFVAAVARGRGVSEATVRGGYGQGRMLTAKDAKAAGMVDGIATLEQLLNRLGSGAASGPGAAVAAPSLGDTDTLRKKIDLIALDS